MKKQLLALGLLFGTVGLNAQSTRLSVYEEFTGETCPPCAATNPGLNALLASPTNTPKVTISTAQGTIVKKLNVTH